MYQSGDRVLYGIHGVCSVLGVEFRKIDRKTVEYYVLEPTDQPGAKYYIPTGNPAAVAKLRKIMTIQELETLLCSDVVRQDAWIADENARKQRYRELINSGDRASLIQMVGTLHTYRKNQVSAGKKFHLCDENFLRDAEKLLSAEFAMVLNIPQNKVGEYIRQRLSE